VRVACFGEVAERIAASVTKGDKVYCEGSMRLERWTTHDGLARADLNCAAWKVEPLGKIGRNKPKRQADSQAPLEREPAPFNDPLDF
jgi:single-stranded DNA-binding protein